MSVTVSGPAALLPSTAANAAPLAAISGPAEDVVPTAVLVTSVQNLFNHWMASAEAEALPVREPAAIAAESEAVFPGDHEAMAESDGFASAMSQWPDAASVWKQSQRADGAWAARTEAVTKQALSAMSAAAFESPAGLDRLTTLKPAVVEGKLLAQPAESAQSYGLDSPAVTALPRSASTARAVQVLDVASAEPPAIAVNKGVQPLLQALGQRIQLQQVQGAEVATVRLDPPQMGSLEIRIRQEGAGVQVHIQASHAEVGRQLNMLVDSLRQELQLRSSDASVTVAQSRAATAGGQGEQQRRDQSTPQQDAEIGLALQAWGNEFLT